MDNRPKIIKRKQAQGFEETSVSQPSSELSEDSPILDAVEVPAPPEQLEALYVPPAPSTPTYSDWQHEFRELEWDLEQEDWESLTYD